MPADKQAANADDAFVISRAFAAPLPVVWAAWSEPEQLEAWWGPKGCAIEVARMEFRPGGFFHYAMRFPHGPEWWGRFLYRQIVARERIVWLNSFSNSGCGITRAPFKQPIPLEILNDARFSERAGNTTVSLRAIPHGAAGDEVEAFREMHPGLEQGYGATFDQLARVLGA